MARRLSNPFYVPLVAVGLLFSVTACAYFVMALRAERHGPEALLREPNRMIVFLDHFGGWLLAAELVALAVTTIAVIGTDGYWTRRAAESADSSATELSTS